MVQGLQTKPLLFLQTFLLEMTMIKNISAKVM